jgi:general secretion pathway protein K
MRRQRGVAIITALLVVALVTVLAVQWMSAQNALGRTVEVQRLSAQARWLLTAATDWAGVLLREDPNPTVDHLGEVWAVPLARTRISDASGRLEAWVSGRIEDAQGRMNLADLVINNTVSDDAVERLQRLLTAAGLPGTQSQPVAKAVLAMTPITPPPQPGLPVTPPYPPRIRSVLELTGREGLSESFLVQLEPYVTVLPRGTALGATAVNINTASAPVLASIHPSIAQVAQAIVAKREQGYYFRNKADLVGQFPALANIEGLADLYDVKSNWFLATGRIELQRVDMLRQALIQRNQLNTLVVWVRTP